MNVTLWFMQDFAYFPLRKACAYPQFAQESGQQPVFYAMLGFRGHIFKFNTN